MDTTIHVAALAALFAVTLWTLTTARRHLFGSKLVRDQGCKPLPRYKHTVPYFGTDLFKRQGQAMQKGDTFGLNRQLHATYGDTFEAWDWGQRTIHTCDPNYMQAALVGDLKVSAWSPCASTLNTDNIVAGALTRQYLDVSTEMIFGESMNALIPGDRQRVASDFLSAFDTALSGALKRRHYGHFKFLLGHQQEWRDCVARVHQFVDAHIDQKIYQNGHQLKDNQRTQTGEKFSFLDELLQQSQDRDFLRNQLLNVFFPARDTSSIGISIVFFILARHPEAFAKIRDEVQKVDQPLSVDIIGSMIYLQRTLRECLRLHTSAGRAIRESLRDWVLPHGGGADGASPIFVPKGTKIDMDFEQVHRNPKIWGSDADEFRPERWTDRSPGWDYIPFIRGHRTCPAQQMIWIQYAFIICRFAQRFVRVENRDSKERFVEQFIMVKQSRNGVKARDAKAGRFDTNWTDASRDTCPLLRSGSQNEWIHQVFGDFDRSVQAEA